MEAEKVRIIEAQRREQHWRRWGPYLSERAWGTVREDYSADGAAWEYFPFEHAHLRAFRWGDDGIAGICDNHQRLCFALALWNGRDPILKERLYGLSGQQGNHGEDVKEVYYYLDSTPTHSYMKCLYKYPQDEFPYRGLLDVNRAATRKDPEYELIEPASSTTTATSTSSPNTPRRDPDDVLIRITVVNRAAEAGHAASLADPVVPQHLDLAPGVSQAGAAAIRRRDPRRRGNPRFLSVHLGWGPAVLFTENQTNTRALWNWGDEHAFTKDAFDRYLIHGEQAAVNPAQTGTKACMVYRLDLAPGESRDLRMRLSATAEASRMIRDMDGLFAERILEADEFYSFIPATLSADAKNVQRQAFAGVLWSKQFYHFVVETWLKGDPGQPPPPASRLKGRDSQWVHLYNKDVISMPDKWEYPWYAAWDLAFHTIPLSMVDPDFAKNQLRLFLREWYLHPNGQVPAYEWAFGDVNPPVHAWACWRVFQIDRKLTDRADYGFLESAFHKLLLNFTWWVNRKDASGSNIFEGGFLGLDNIGVFDRSAPLPGGGLPGTVRRHQLDGHVLPEHAQDRAGIGFQGRPDL